MPMELLEQVPLQCTQGAQDWIPFMVHGNRGRSSLSGALRCACCACRYAAKMEHEGAAMYDAAVALRDTMIALGLACDGGKDSLSMAAAAGGEVRCPCPCCAHVMGRTVLVSREVVNPTTSLIDVCMCQKLTGMRVGMTTGKLWSIWTDASLSLRCFAGCEGAWEPGHQRLRDLPRHHSDGHARTEAPRQWKAAVGGPGRRQAAARRISTCACIQPGQAHVFKHDSNSQHLER